MILHALEIPDDRRQLPQWLEGQLVGGDLTALVAQLTAVHGGQQNVPSLDAVLGDRRESMLRNGLAALTEQQISKLMLSPQLLLDLQELVCAQGGAYWMNTAGNAGKFNADSANSRRRIERFLATQTEEPAEFRASPAVQPKRTSSSVSKWLVAWAVAATLLLTFVGYQKLSPPVAGDVAAVAWGWAKPGALPQSVSRAEYLNSLADAAHQWFNKRPATPAELAQRIAQLRQGCSTLILAPHTPLPPADRQWLVERCKAWAGKFDAQLAAVEAGRDPNAVREETDAIVNKLIDALRERSKAEAV